MYIILYTFLEHLIYLTCKIHSFHYLIRKFLVKILSFEVSFNQLRISQKKCKIKRIINNNLKLDYYSFDLYPKEKLSGHLTYPTMTHIIKYYIMQYFEKKKPLL